MKWIVLSKNSPAQLHAALESAVTHGITAKPSVLFQANNQDAFDGYQLVASRFRATWLFSDDASFGTSVGDLLCESRLDDTLDPMALLTTDSSLFVKNADMGDAWAALKDHSVLSVSLHTSETASPTAQRFVKHHLSHYVFDRPEGMPAFSYGDICRTGDLLGSVSRAVFTCPQSLRDVIVADKNFSRREKWACLPEPVLLDYPCFGGDHTRKYLNGNVIDLSQLNVNSVQYSWKPYEEQYNGLIVQQSYLSWKRHPRSRN